MDSFIEMLPARLFGHEDGMTFRVVEQDGHRSINIRSGVLIDQLLRGMRHAVAAMAAESNHLIVDDVMFDASEANLYRRLLAETELHFVGLFAPLSILEARERERGDREIGLARGQYEIVHRGMNYDLELDTTTLTPKQCAEAICKAFNLAMITTTDL